MADKTIKRMSPRISKSAPSTPPPAVSCSKSPVSQKKLKVGGSSTPSMEMHEEGTPMTDETTVRGSSRNLRSSSPSMKMEEEDTPMTMRRSSRNLRSSSPSTNSVTKSADSRGKLPPSKKQKVTVFSRALKKCSSSEIVSFLIGKPIPAEEAKKRWPWRYEEQVTEKKGRKLLSEDDDDEDKMVLNVKCHYAQAEIDKCIFNIGDCAYVKGEDGGKNFVGRVLEFFKTTEGEDYFRVQWFFRAEDTVMKEQAASHDKKRLFFSDLMNDNPLDCIVSKVNIIQVAPNVNLHSKPKSVRSCDFYYDMKYSLEYTSFSTLVTGNSIESSDSYSSMSNERITLNGVNPDLSVVHSCKLRKSEVSLLDLYSGCGGMSTGLCLGAKLSHVHLVTRWALDFNQYACESLRLNHPETQIRNESAEDFFELLKEWEKLCKRHGVHSVENSRKSNLRVSKVSETKVDSEKTSVEFEVSRLVDICYGDPTETGKRGLKFKVRWKGYGPSEDTWEPIEGLSNCQDRIRNFVIEGLKSKILPLPGDADVICGGPPCQGISGFNRHRNIEAPLDDERNRQIVVFMDIVRFLKPKYVLMENVIDILRFANGFFGRYAISHLVHMNYQARLGIMAAGCYGLPQFRLRAFLWGAHPDENLPQFPLPTHDVILKYGVPNEFERSTVAYDEGQPRNLEKSILLRDAISDLPPVTSHEVRDKMPYKDPPQTEFQKYIRSSENEMMGFASDVSSQKSALYDHLPIPLNEDDYLRVCQIPKRKGANFRDLPGVVVGHDNVVQLDPNMERLLLPSGNPLVPDYALNWREGKCKRPFGRLWWDETVPTLVTTPDARNLAMLHPEQDRILTVREYARLQGFPDYFRFCGSVKQRYRQIGNAVAVPVSRALGYALGVAWLKQSTEKPLMTLPPKFSHSNALQLMKSSSETEE